MKNKIEEIIEKNKDLVKEGFVADYIPALSKANPNDIGVSIVDLNGNIYNEGDYNVKFTIQSISKVLSLILALQDHGEEKVFQKVGYEPTDEPFNTIYKLDFSWNKPSNPMINSGAIVTTSLIKGSGDDKINRILNLIKKVTGNPNISIDEEVYLSEKETGHRNRAMAYLLKSKGILLGDTEEVLDAYFKQCSIQVTSFDLAKIGLFIAKGCPLETKGLINNSRVAAIVTAIMFTSGMYNFSGEYAVNVGIPSKSGVGGGILGVVPGNCGIGIYGPALDRYGNSSVGYGIMRDLSQQLKLNIFSR